MLEVAFKPLVYKKYINYSHTTALIIPIKQSVITYVYMSIYLLIHAGWMDKDFILVTGTA